VRFSTRTPSDLTPTPLARLLEGEQGGVDLTLSNPTRAGLEYDEAAIRAALARPEVLRYEPSALGHEAARQAVARYLASIGRPVSHDRLALTASTSEAYGALFKLLCDPGEAVAGPAPSYPLVPHLGGLEGVDVIPYQLHRDRDRWRIDPRSLEDALAAGARAVVVVSPNNPTGNVPDAAERRLLAEACRRHDAALIVDEVFAPYGWHDGPVEPVAGDDGPLAFVLDGLSKSAALPQLKLGWVAVRGPEVVAREALTRLEWVLDAYLSVSAPVQAGAAELLATAPAMQRRLRARLLANLTALRTALASVPGVEVLAGDGGWYAVLALAGETDEEALVTALITDAGVRVQPGFFYDFAAEGYLVVSLLVPEATFVAGARALARGLAAR
jgi:aspartate/methionine/tyrosine aminotransferase